MEPSGAIFSEDRKYRYVLWRQMKSDLPMVQYIGLNPSKANENVNDNTIKKLVKITLNNGYGGFYMTNLFGLVSHIPQVLVSHPDPIGENDHHLLDVSKKASATIFCWGSFKEAYSSGRASAVMNMFMGTPFCIRKTKLGRPWHPLYCFDNEQFIKF